MTKYFISALFAVTLYSCQTQKKFDKEKWAEVADLMTFPNRKSMVDDLSKNIPLKGKSYQDIVSLLGQPQHSLDSTMNIGYKIDEDYGSDIDPIYTQTLLLHFDQDSTVKSFEVKEWKK
ncbi:hypothetical protein [Lacibacter sp.]|uniref:hypothetical protein n=1 Tax=Lacibacter sp. TaxID=1915409 RepID=UPI002B4AD2ED|nr:hypothetical protein [Lacibacter sp.]HLP35646.1 hypothetical protein [Lacibacter sp.]